jgi:branched-chain amino acid transport system permease protein
VTGVPWLRRAAWGAGIVAALWGFDRLATLEVTRTFGDGSVATVPIVNRYVYQIIVLAAINVILAVSLQLINGITGQFSIGHAGFMAIGGYAAAAFGRDLGPGLAKLLGGGPFSEHGVFLIALLVGSIAAAVAGLLVGIPSLRLRGDYLAIVTLGFGEIIRVVLLNLDWVGGARGFPGIPQRTTFFVGGFFAVLTIVVVRNVYRSSFGRAMLAVREDEIAAEAMGIETTRTKVLAFVLSSGLAGLAGGLFAHLLMFLHTNTFTFVKSIEIVMMIIVGGLGSITGAVFGGVVVSMLPEVLRPSNIRWVLSFVLPERMLPQADLRMVIYSLVIILMIRFRPKGVLGSRELSDIVASLRSRWKGGRK